MDLKSIAFLVVLSPPSGVFFDEIAVTMMWNLRAELCENVLSETFALYTSSDWCDGTGGLPYMGQFTITGMTSEQQCWVSRLVIAPN
jgi:hypothetical protein